MIEVFRPVLNINEKTMVSLGAIASGHGITGVRFKPPHAVRCVLLSGGVVRAAVDAAGAELTEDRVEEFADYIADHLPPSADTDSITVPALPVISLRTGGSNRRYALALGARQPILLSEQQAVHRATANWLGLPYGQADWITHARGPLVIVANGRKNSIERLTRVCAESDHIANLTLELQYPFVDSLQSRNTG